MKGHDDSRAVPNSAAHADGFRDADPLLLQQHHGEVRVVDVRELDEFTGELGHVPGAQLVPLSIVPVKAREWDPDEAVVVVCRSGGPAVAARTLVQMGFTRVINLRGGMIAYTAAKLPADRSAPPSPL